MTIDEIGGLIIEYTAILNGLSDAILAKDSDIFDNIKLFYLNEHGSVMYDKSSLVFSKLK